MTDDELECRLRQYRAVGPPGALRARALAAAGRRGPSDAWIGWGIAAASVATVCVLPWLSALPEQRRHALAMAEVSRQVEDMEEIVQVVGPHARHRVMLALMTSEPSQGLSREDVARELGERRW
jgi:hypothetical protein